MNSPSERGVIETNKQTNKQTRGKRRYWLLAAACRLLRYRARGGFSFIVVVSVVVVVVVVVSVVRNDIWLHL